MSVRALPPELQRVHMVGIGGAGMSGIARILLDRGGLVSGSDAKESRGVAALRARGAQIRIGHDASALDMLPGGPTVVVSTHAAIPKDNPELLEAHRRGIAVILRPEVLARLMDGYTTVMVTGTHGKTTTTSMVIVALQRSGFDPSFAVGGDLGEAGTNAHHGSGECFVAEADESDGSLLEYTPDVAVVTNIEADHLDFFGSAEAYRAVFDEFVARLRPGGALVVCADDPGSAALADRAEGLGVRVLRYGSGDTANLAGALVNWEQQGTGSVATVQLTGESQPRGMRLAVPGRHMALNALGALLAATQAGADVGAVLDGLAAFEGVRRRFESVGTAAGVRVFDDYAHHPTEVQATLEALRAVAGHGRSIVVFQPHLYSRTQSFAREFGQALSLADEVFVLDVYAAREQPIAGVSGAAVAEHVTVGVRYVPDFSAVADLVAGSARPGDVVVTMGAGDVTLLGREILTAVQSRASRDAPGGRIPMTGPRSTTDGPGDETMGEAADVAAHEGTVDIAPEDSPENGPDDSEEAGQTDFEGPRRRARREREERRAAQERATAIENARREAKRKVTGRSPDEPKPAARGLIRGLKVLMWSALASVIAVGVGLLLYFTPIMSARVTDISGLVTITQEEVEQAAAVPADTPLLQIDTDTVAERVATIRRVASARVQREYPSTLRITIVERIPLVVKDYPDGSHLFDRDGVDFATAPPPPGLPYLDADTPGPTDLPTKAALQVLTALRPEVAGQVTRIAAPSVASITLTLVDGREVIWGTTERTDEKALKLGALLTQPGHTYDLSSPDLPTVK